MRGLFVTGTDTGVGKTIVSAALLAAMRAAGEPVRAHKPVVTGLDDLPDDWPADHELLAAAADMDPEEVALLRYGPAVSPHLAAALAGEQVAASALLAAAHAAGTEHAALVVEGVGGLLTPLTEDFTVCDFAAALGLPVVIVARPGLGTINHSLLTIAAAREAGLNLAAIVLTPWPAEPSEMERSNRATIDHMGRVEVTTLAHVNSPGITALGDAGAGLPWRRWLGNLSPA